jgi:hypothetical protein
MLAAIEEQDPDLAKSLLTRIYRFDDISALNKSVVQRVLGEVDSTNLTTALFGADEQRQGSDLRQPVQTSTTDDRRRNAVYDQRPGVSYSAGSRFHRGSHCKD